MEGLTREEVIASNPILQVMESYGLEFKRSGKEWVTKCCFHDDKTPSLSVNQERKVWKCHPCDIGGSVIDFVMLKEGCDFKEAIARLTKTVTAARNIERKEVCTYDYCDENGKLLYQKVRFEPKTFRQRCKNSDGEWVWAIDGVRRVLYRLQEVISSQDLFIVEGEKDANSLYSIGFTATTNTEGSSQWLDSYSEFLKGKNVVVIPDNDDPGRRHADEIIRSIAGKAPKIFRFEVPAPDKDISDFINRHNGNAKAEILKILDALKPINPVPDLPVMSLEELEADYKEFVKTFDKKGLTFSKWLPGLNSCVRALVPGDVVVFLADTGAGKTTAISNLAYHSGLPTLIFEMELAGTRMFERSLQMALQKPGDEIFHAYRNGSPPEWKMLRELKNIFICPLSRMNPVEMERIINQAEIKMGQRPVLVAVDYMQLMQGVGGSRYERASYVAEQMKIIAKSTNTIVIEASQVARPVDRTGKVREMTLHDGKDSGSLESSAGLVLGMWREGEQEEILKIKVLKNSNGPTGKVITCNYEGSTMRITEQSPIDPADIPRPRNVVAMRGVYD